VPISVKVVRPRDEVIEWQLCGQTLLRGLWAVNGSRQIVSALQQLQQLWAI
jgi:hypothetical protein